MAGRPRRTRIYGANYNIGESYYKSALDNLDRKQFGSYKDSSAIHGAGKPNRDLFPEITQPKPKFQRALTEEPTYFDYRGRGDTTSNFLDEELDEDVQATLRKIREVKKANVSFLDDSNISLGDHNRARSSDVGRFLKSFSDSDDDINATSMIRLKASSGKAETVQSNSAASLRANATMERLHNIESEMSERFEKQVQREKRSANLKKFLNETNIESSKSVKKVSF